MPFIFLSTKEKHLLNVRLPPKKKKKKKETTLVIYEDGKDLQDFTGDKKKENTNSTLGEEEWAEGEAKPEASV